MAKKEIFNVLGQKCTSSFQSQSIYSWKDARQIVTNAYSNFDKRAGNIVNKFFDNSWIHAPVKSGKSPGAFAASTVPSVHPFILVNYQAKQEI